MALVLKDRVKETCSSPGLGTVTLLGAMTEYQSFSAIGDGNTTYYTIADQNGANWEVGIGTYTASGTTLSRDTVLASSNGGALVDFPAGSKNVWCDYPAGKAAYQDASGVVSAPTFTASTAVKSPYFDATSSAGGALRNASGTSQIQWGAGGSNNVTFDVATNLNPANAQVDISPTGTGHVHINPAAASTMDNVAIGETTPTSGKFTTLSSNANTSFSGANCSISIQPTGTGVVYVNPATTGAMDNMSVGQTTAAAGKFTDFEVTGTFKVDNAEGTTGQVLTSQGAGVTPVWTTPATGTVTSVTGTAPIASSGGNTPAISISQATTSTNGYLSSTDWNTFNNKAPTASPTFTGTPVAPTASSSDSSTQIATTAFVKSVPLNSFTAPTGDVSLNSHKITSLATPTADTDAANKAYVDSVAQGLNVKQASFATTTGNITLSGLSTQAGGDWASSLTAGDRILVKNQTAQAENGIYVADSSTWTRASDANTWAELISAFTFVSTGATEADTGWVCTVDAGGTLGTTPVTWAQFSGAGTYTAGTGLTLTGNQFSITNTAVTAASYGSASKTLTATVNAQGQLTALADTDIAIANTQVSGLGTMSTQNANNVAITGGSIQNLTTFNGITIDGGTF